MPPALPRSHFPQRDFAGASLQFNESRVTRACDDRRCEDDFGVLIYRPDQPLQAGWLTIRRDRSARGMCGVVPEFQ